MSNNLAKTIGYIISAIMILGPLVFWVANPELTETQILLKFWYFYVIGVLLAILSLSIERE